MSCRITRWPSEKTSSLNVCARTSSCGCVRSANRLRRASASTRFSVPASTRRKPTRRGLRRPRRGARYPPGDPLPRAFSMRSSWTTSAATLELAFEPNGPRRAALETALRAAIRENRLVAGTRLPSTRALAADLGLARGTVVEAYAQLRAEGYLESRHGAGTWVAGIGAANV